MKLERHKGNWREAPALVIRTCPWCHEEFATRDPERAKCKKPVCMRAYKREYYQRFLKRGRPNGHRLSAPELKTACEALEAQLTGKPQKDWPTILHAFQYPRMPGYPDLAKLTREVIACKFHMNP